MTTIYPFAFAADPGFGLPPAVLENLYAQETPAGPVSYTLLPRPGMTALREVGSGPTRGKFRESGVFEGDDFTVSGTELYRNSTYIGVIAGSGICAMAASSTELVIVGGGSGNAYVYNGTTLTQITDPDLPSTVSWVAYKDGRFIYTAEDTDQFSWSALNDATTIDGLDFARAEGSPDPLLGVLVVADEIAFVGTASIAFWTTTSDANAPFQPIPNRAYTQRGAACMASVVLMDNSFVFVGDDRVCYRAGNVPERISDHGVEAALRACSSISDLTAMFVPWNGHSFWVVNIPGETTWVWDAAVAGKSVSAWATWSTFGRTTFRCSAAVAYQGDVTLGDDTTGEQFTLSDDYNDDDILIRRLASAFIPQDAGNGLMPTIILRGAVGVGTEVGPDPLCQMRLSRDRGNTWTDWRDGSLGTAPNYITPPKWHRNGRTKPPGTLIEFRCTEALLTAWWGVSLGASV